MPTYPSALPISPGYGRKPQDYLTIRTPFEQGYVQSRSQVTRGLRRFRFEHLQLTASEKATWEAFWEEVKGGGLTFTFVEPLTGTNYTCRFDTSNGIPEMAPVGPDTWAITGIMLEEAP